jgi:AAA+ ATPase superfamily predicted ATPase
VNIILISGKSNSGKGTVAKKIEEILNNQSKHIIRCSLSTYIREIAKEDYFWDGIDTLESRKFMAESYRIGTEFYPYHMARRVWERDIIPYANKDTIAIVESLREKVNYDYFLDLYLNTDKINSLITVRVVRPNFNILQNEEMENHVSESDLDSFPFDYVIENSGTVEELDNKLKELF